MLDRYKKIVRKAITDKMTLIAEHNFCEVIKESITLEVFPYMFDGDFLVCYDIKADQPYAINLKNVTKIFPNRKKDDSIPEFPA